MPKALESKLLLVKHRVHKLELNEDTVEDLVIRVDEAEKALRASEKHVLYLDDQIIEQSTQMLAKDAKATNNCEWTFKLLKRVTDLLRNMDRSRAQKAACIDLLEEPGWHW